MGAYTANDKPAPLTRKRVWDAGKHAALDLQTEMCKIQLSVTNEYLNNALSACIINLNHRYTNYAVHLCLNGYRKRFSVIRCRMPRNAFFVRLKSLKIYVFVSVICMCVAVLGFQYIFGWKSIVVGYHGYSERYLKSENPSKT